jgi:rhodanese-related sulfurtransferase
METNMLILAGIGTLALVLALRAFPGGRSGLAKEAIRALVDQGAMVLDVRTPGEFSRGHAPGSRNIPLDRLSGQLKALDGSKPILVCCASGARSAAAKAMLDRAGFTQVHNAGPWRKLLA